MAVGRFLGLGKVQSWKLISRQNNNFIKCPPSPPPYNVDVCITSLPIVHVVINIVFGGRGGDILMINNSNFIKCPPTILIAHDFYKESTYIISMIVEDNA